jgi:hypothetical protein
LACRLLSLSVRVGRIDDNMEPKELHSCKIEEKSQKGSRSLMEGIPGEVYKTLPFEHDPPYPGVF